MKLYSHTNNRLGALAVAAIALHASANAAVAVVAGDITTGSLVGSGLIIDTPVTTFVTADVGWSGTGTIGEASAQSGWEPAGDTGPNSPLFVGGSGSSASWTFDLADGLVINAVYAVWQNNGATPGATYSYSEATAGNSGFISHSAAASSGDLVYQGANFQNLISGPITVAGGDGFRITAAHPTGGFFMSDAMIVDFSPIPEPTAALLGGLGLLTLMRRRR